MRNYSIYVPGIFGENINGNVQFQNRFWNWTRTKNHVHKLIIAQNCHNTTTRHPFPFFHAFVNCIWCFGMFRIYKNRLKVFSVVHKCGDKNCLDNNIFLELIHPREKLSLQVRVESDKCSLEDVWATVPGSEWRSENSESRMGGQILCQTWISPTMDRLRNTPSHVGSDVVGD